MLKPQSLHKHLLAAVPAFKRDPDKLVINAREGRIVCTGTGSLSFEYAYTLNVIALDYAAHADAVIVPLLAWLQEHQIELFDNTDKRERAIRFEVDQLNRSAVDLSIEIDLTERVIVKPAPAPGEPQPGDGGQRFDVVHVPEPDRVGIIKQRERWTFWLRDEKLAEWDYDPR